MWKHSISIAIVLSSSYKPIAQAQINPDDSLGSESPIVVPDNINGIPSDRIEGGATRDDNLFHSFQDFNIAPSRGAYFTNPAGINNIFSRVTGTNVSQIDGTLGVLGNANLFLINPNGILFGADSRLDLRGSFFASSAESLLFNDFAFSADNPQAPPLLEVSIPIGLSFRNDPGAIDSQSNSLDANNNSVGLQVGAGQSLTLIGGNINLIGANLTASEGRVELGAVATAGTVSINELGELIFADDINKGNINISNSSRITVNPFASGNGGEIEIVARDIALDSGSILDASNLSTEGNAGNISLQADNNILVSNSSGILSNIGEVAKGNVGEIDLEADSIFLTNGSQLQTRFFANEIGNESTGKIFLLANDSINIDDSAIFTNNETGAIADTVDIKITSNSISFDNSTLATTNMGDGKAGDVVINTVKSGISLTNSSIFTNSITGQSGNIALSGKSLLLTDNSSLGGFATNNANAGNVTVETTNFMTLDGESSVSVFASGNGMGGDVTINSNQLNIINGSDINVATLGNLPAGQIAIDTSESITIDNASQLLLQTDSSGDGGSLELNTKSLAITGGSQILSGTFAGGNGGNLHINANTIEITGITADGSTASRIGADTSGSGAGGDIQIDANNLTIKDGSAISAFAIGSNAGKGGNIDISVKDSINISGFRFPLFPSSIDAETNSTNDAGNINITTANLQITDGAKITTSTLGEGAGGNVNILATDSLAVSGFIPNTIVSSQIASQSITSLNQSVGSAGNISISTPNLLVQNRGQITVSGLVGGLGTASAGNIEIDADTIRLDNFGILSAQTFGTEGNINLISKDIFLGGESNITTNASGSSSGGNITINTENLIAFPNENSDISANAENSLGGRVFIDAKGIFGTEFRETPTFLSDITATSELGAEFIGEVTLNTPDFDPTTGLINLPASVGDASDQISQNPCQQGVGSQFIVTGKGGLPPTVNEALNSEKTQVSLIKPVPSPQQMKEASNISSDHPQPEAVPAMGWIFNDRGEVTLTAYATSQTPTHRSRQQAVNHCSN